MGNAGNIQFTCGECGSTKFAYPSNPQPDDTVRCAGCDASWRFEDFKRLGMEKAKEAVTDHLRDLFRNL